MAFAWWFVSLPASTALPVFGGQPEAAREDRSSGLIAASEQPQVRAESHTPDAKRVLVRSALTPEMVSTALALLDLPMGAERPLELDGRAYVFVLEPHYHPPGFVGAPTGWHKGVTIYELVPVTTKEN
jgi:hypothetical protein